MYQLLLYDWYFFVKTLKIKGLLNDNYSKRILYVKKVDIMKMKIKDPEKLKKARNIVNLLLEGINPITYDPIEDESFLNDPMMIRIFSYIGLVLTQDITETELEEEKEKESINIFTKRTTQDAISGDYKSINEKIKSSKMQVFNKATIADLKKLSDYMEKEENSV